MPFTKSPASRVCCAVASGFLALLATVDARADLARQQRVVLHEMFTATWCVFCPPVRQAQSSLFEQNPQRYVPIQVHAGDEYATTWGNNRSSMYAVSGYPTTAQDGVGIVVGNAGYSTYESMFNLRRQVPTDVRLKVTGQQVSGMQYLFTVRVGLASEATGPRTVRVHTVQTLDFFLGADSRNFFVQAANPLDVTLQPGTQQEFTRTFTLSGASAANIQNVRVVTFAGNATTSASEIHQAAQIRYPFYEDCNGNAVPDPNEIGGCPPGDPACADCNANELLDSCEIPYCDSIECRDCNGNGVLDGCEFPLTDCNADGIADACQLAAGLLPDCNGNGVPDGCDLANFTAADCNGNNRPDTCDIADGTDPDCNNNAFPDSCDLYADFASTSGIKSPLGAGTVQTHTFVAPPAAIDTVSVRFYAFGDLSTASENVAILLNGQSYGNIFAVGAFDCAESTATISLTPAQWTALRAAGNGDVVVTMTPSAAVGPNSCGGPANTWIRVALEYTTGGVSQDQNGNGIPDECEAPAGCPGDLNCDGLVSFTDIDLFVEALSYPGGAGWPNPACPWSNGDVNGDNDVTFADIDPFVAAIGVVCP